MFLQQWDLPKKEKYTVGNIYTNLFIFVRPTKESKRYSILSKHINKKFIIRNYSCSTNK